MKTSIIILFSILYVACHNTTRDYYAGYVYDNNGQPLSNVIIKENYIKSANKCITDSDGYFKLDRSLKNFIPELIFEKEGYKKDTVHLVRGQHSPPLYILFLREQTDTLKMSNINQQKEV